MFDIQSYQKAESVSDAIRLLGEDPGSWTSMTCPN